MDDKQTIAVAEGGFTWLQKHERMIIVLLVLLAGGWLGNKWLNNSAAEAQTKYAIAQAALDQTRLQASQARQDYQMTVDALTKQNASLAAAVASRNTVLVQQQEKIKTLPLPEVANRWQDLIGGSGDIVQSTTGLNISDSGARRTVIQLESVPVLQRNVDDYIKITDNQKIELGKADVLIAGLNKQITGTEETCKLQVAAVKASARKSKRNFFIMGFIAGIATRILVKF